MSREEKFRDTFNGSQICQRAVLFLLHFCVQNVEPTVSGGKAWGLCLTYLDDAAVVGDELLRRHGEGGVPHVHRLEAVQPREDQDCAWTCRRGLLIVQASVPNF